MNIKIILLIFLLSLNINIITADTHYTKYLFNGNTSAMYPNEGYMVTYAYGYVPAYSGAGSGETAYATEYNTLGNTVKYKYTASQTIKGGGAMCGSNSYARAYNQNSITPTYSYCYHTTAANNVYKYKCNYSRESSSNFGTTAHIGVYVAGAPSICNEDRFAICRSRLTVTVGTTYNISGTSECLDYVELYSDSTLLDAQNFTDDYIYNFTNLIPGFNYTLIYSNGYEYVFEIVDTDIEYNYDACSHTQYRFEESCGNLIPDSEGYYCEYTESAISCNWFEESDGILDISNSSATKIEIYTNTFIGQTGWLIDPVVSDTTYTLENPNIAWGLKVIVQNESDSSQIDGAMVKVDQDCYCTSEYSTRQKLTVNGMASFGDMSLQDASLWVMASGYKILDENSTGYSAFLSGCSNFSSKTWIVKLAPSTSNNSSSFYESGNKVDIHFRDVNGNRTSQILDTNSEVYLYYENNNTEEEAMTLKFQSSSTHTYFIDVDSWTIAYDTIGHKTISQADFTPWDYSYRAVIYNSSIYGWNITIPLTVRNATKEEDQHYQNLTTNLWFMYADDGKVDYRDDMKVAIHAGSNNTTLMTIDVELWKDGVYIAYKNLTATDFINADYPYFYVWDPVFDYITGSNYSIRMYGFDRTLLETDYVECVTDDTTRKNKLTIGVKDKYGTNLNNCYIYLEDWGSLPTGTLYYNSYEGIDNGDYRYKASKSGYTGSGWDKVNLTDEDKIVWYVLSEDYTNTSIAATKFTDDDIKGFFFPLMFFLLICIVLGGLKYVAS